MAGFSWIVVVVLVGLFLALLKFRHVKHRFFAVILIFLLAFFYFTAASTFADKDVDLNSFDGWISAGKIYFGWLAHAFDNSRVVLGNAIKMDWVGNPSNNSTRK